MIFRGVYGVFTPLDPQSTDEPAGVFEFVAKLRARVRALPSRRHPLVIGVMQRVQLAGPEKAPKVRAMMDSRA